MQMNSNSNQIQQERCFIYPVLTYINYYFSYLDKELNLLPVHIILINVSI